MNNNITLEQVIQQNCINLLSHKDFGYKFITKEDNLIFRENKTSAVLLKKILIERLYALNSYEYKGQNYKFSANNIAKAVEDLDVSLNEGLIVANEKITVKKVGSMFLAIVGCILASGFLESSIGSISLIGVLGGVGAAVFCAVYTLDSTKVINKGCHTYCILFYSLILIVILLLPFTNFGQINHYVNVNPLSNVLFLILHSFISFALPYICLTTALNYVESGVASILLSGCEPIAALIFGIICYFEIPTVLMLCGLVIVIVALVILCKPSKKEEVKV